MITSAMVRSEIGDQLRWCSASPEVLASAADGALTQFYLRFPNANLTAGIRVYFGTRLAGSPMSWAQVLPGDSTNPWMLGTDANGMPLIQFTAAPPPAGKAVAARYMFTAFSDTEIAAEIAGTSPRDTDRRTLWAIHLGFIPSILSRRDAMMVTRNGEITTDPSLWARAQENLIVHLSNLLAEEPIGQGPAMGTGGYLPPMYQP